MNRSVLFILVLSLTILVSHSPAAAQNGKSALKALPLSLREAQTYAEEHNYDLINSSKEVDIARKRVKENTAIGLPQISAGVDYMDYLKTPTTVIPNFIPDTTGNAPKELEVKFGVKYNLNATATATQLIYSGQYLVGLQTANAFLETAKQRNLRDKVEIRDQVADAYYRLLVIDQAIKILDSTYVVVNKLVIEAEQSFKAGLIEDIDVDQADLNRSNLEATITDTKSARNIAYAGFKFLIGLKEDQECVLTDDLNYFLAQVDHAAMIAKPFDYTRNIDYTLLKKADYLVFMQYKLAKTAYQPTLAGFFSYAWSAQRNEWTFLKSNENWFNTINWGLSLQIPIFSSGSRKFAVDQARLRVEQTKVTDEKTRVALQLQVETAKKDFSNSYSVYQNKKRGFETALKIYEKTTVKYQQGLSSSTDLNQRYTQFLQTNSDYMQSIYAVLSTQTRLSKLLEQF